METGRYFFMVSEDINDGIVRLESSRSHLVTLVNSLKKVRLEQVDMSADIDTMIDKLNTRINRTDKQLKELCDYAVEIAQTEAEVYDAMYRSDDDTSDNMYLFM